MGNLKIASVAFLYILILASSIHAGKKKKTSFGPKPGEVVDGVLVADVHGTMDVILPPNGLPTPFRQWFFAVHITVDGDGGGNFEAHVPWSTCANNKCEYKVQNIRGKEGQSYTVEVNHYDKMSDSHNNLTKLQTTGTLKTGDNKLDIKYNIPQKSASSTDTGSWGTTSSSSSASSSGSGPKEYLNIHGEVEVTLGESTFARLLTTWWVGVHITLDGEQDGYYDTSVTWSSCKRNKCSYKVQVHGKVGQSYTVEVNHYEKTSDSRKYMRKSDQKGVLKQGDNKLDIKYNLSPPSVNLVGVSTDSRSSSRNLDHVFLSGTRSTSSSSSSSTSTSTGITVEGSIDVIPPHGPKPDAVMINLILDGDTKPYSALANWPSDCPGNKCGYVIKNIPASTGHKYKFRISVIRITSGKQAHNTNVIPEKTAWSEQMTIGGNKVNLKYNSNNFEVTREN